MIPDWAIIAGLYLLASSVVIFWMLREARAGEEELRNAERLNAHIAQLRYQPQVQDIVDQWYLDEFKNIVEAERAREESPFGPVRKWGHDS